MRCHTLSINYAVEIGIENMLKLRGEDSVLDEKLQESKINYNGHFGPYVYFQLPAGYDVELVVEVIESHFK